MTSAAIALGVEGAALTAEGVLLAGAKSVLTQNLGPAGRILSAVTSLAGVVEGGIVSPSDAAPDGIGGVAPAQGTPSALPKTDPTADEVLKGGTGYKSFDAFKGAQGKAAGPGDGPHHWHHVVEQSKGAAKGGPFATEQIQNTKNITSIPKDVHERISGFYSSKPDFAGGQTVRDWLRGQSFRDQYDFGRRIIDLGLKGIPFP